MKKITTLLTACLIAGTGFSQKQLEWMGVQDVKVWDHTTANWHDLQSPIPFPIPIKFDAGDVAIFNDNNSVLDDALTITVAGEVKVGGINFTSSKSYEIKGADATADFISGTGTLTIDGTGTLVLDIKNALTGGTILNNGTVDMKKYNSPNVFGDKIVLNGGDIRFAHTDSKNTPAVTIPVEISDGKSAGLWFPRYAQFRSPLKGSGELVIHGGGDRVLLGQNNIAPDWSEFTGNLRIEKQGTLDAGYYGIQVNTEKTFDYETFTGIDSTLYRVVTIGDGAAIATYSGTRAYAIGELRSTGKTGKLGNYIKDSTGPKIYWIVGGFNTDVEYAGIIGSIGEKGYNATGFIKVGTGTYTLTNDNNLMQVIGLEVREGKVLACDDVLRGFYSGSVGGYALVKATGILGGTGRIQGNVDIYGKLEPGKNGIGTLMIADSLRTEADASLMGKKNLTLYPGSVSEFEINSKNAYDKVEVYGNVSFNVEAESKPTIKVTIPGAYNIQDGDQFEILSAFTCNDETIDFNIDYPTVEGITWSYDIVKLGEEENQNPRIPEGAALKFKVVVKATGSGVGIKDDKVAAAGVVTLYPNPTYNEFNVSVNDTEINSVDVYNLQGQILKSEQANGNQATISVNELPAGVYIVKVYTTSGVIAQRLVKK